MTQFSRIINMMRNKLQVIPKTFPNNVLDETYILSGNNQLSYLKRVFASGRCMLPLLNSLHH